ncbi:MAG TPA: ribosome maturation factor RimP [Nocardioidaceae bacterium]|nr:ribosome maturation factor RimP [Nocardioidaceae bacterium]
MARGSDREALLTLLAPTAAQHGLDLEDVVVTPAGKRRLLRVIVDRDGGVELDAVAQVSTAVSKVLDDTDAMGGAPYVLEVTSPGVDRPLTEPRHWRRASGRLVKTALADGSTVEGRVVGTDDDGVTLAVDGARQQLAWADLGTGRVQVEFNRKDTTELED